MTNIFENVESVIINNKEVKSIITSDDTIIFIKESSVNELYFGMYNGERNIDELFVIGVAEILDGGYTIDGEDYTKIRIKSFENTLNSEYVQVGDEFYVPTGSLTDNDMNSSPYTYMIYDSENNVYGLFIYFNTINYFPTSYFVTILNKDGNPIGGTNTRTTITSDNTYTKTITGKLSKKNVRFVYGESHTLSVTYSDGSTETYTNLVPTNVDEIIIQTTRT